jgi:hypothetical protein
MKDNKDFGVNPMEVSLEDAAQEKQLADLLKMKAEEKMKLTATNGLRVLSKSKFYYGTNGDLREHIATYKGYAIMIKQEKISEDLNEKEVTMFPTLITLPELKMLKKVNGNVVRKLQPKSIHEYEKLTLIHGVVIKIDEGL